MKDEKTLKLTLNRESFDVMLIGEKKMEFRKPSKWIRSRLFDSDGNKREYDSVKFTNGYGKDRPYFIVKFLGFHQKIHSAYVARYSNGLRVDVALNDFVIQLGDITKRGNLAPIRYRDNYGGLRESMKSEQKFSTYKELFGHLDKRVRMNGKKLAEIQFMPTPPPKKDPFGKYFFYVAIRVVGERHFTIWGMSDGIMLP